MMKSCIQTLLVASLFSTLACHQTAPLDAQAKAKAAAPADKAATKVDNTQVVDRGTTVEARDQVDADGVIRRGGAITIKKGGPMTVSAIFANAKKFDKTDVRIAGTADKVCAKKGCWWTMVGDKPEHSIRITAKDYGFFVPSNVKGKRAVVKGLLEVKNLSKEEAEHLAKDSGDKNAKPIQHEVRVMATSIEMRPAS